MQIYIRPQPFKAISFDLDDTLYSNGPIIAKAESALLSFMHQDYPKTQSWQLTDWRKLKLSVLQQWPALVNDPSAARKLVLEQGLLMCGYSVAEAKKGAKLGFDCFYYHRSDFAITDDVLELLKQLAKHYPLIGITNGNVDADRIGLSSVMQFVINAGDGLRMKPHGDMFELACDKLNIQANELLHVGDSQASDVVGARLAGCQSVWLNPPMGHVQRGQSMGYQNQCEELSQGLPHFVINQLDELSVLLSENN